MTIYIKPRPFHAIRRALDEHPVTPSYLLMNEATKKYIEDYAKNYANVRYRSQKPNNSYDEVCGVPIIIKDNVQDSCIEFGFSVIYKQENILMGTISIKIEEDGNVSTTYPVKAQIVEQTFDNVEPHTTYQMTVEQAAKLYYELQKYLRLHRSID